MYCAHCGKEIKNDTSFCENCGTKVQKNNVPPYNEYTNKSYGNSYNKNYNYNRDPNSNNQNNSNNYYNNQYNPNYNNNYPSYDAPSLGFAWLCFFFPIVGLILYLIWKDQYPLKAHSCGKGALISVIVSAILFVFYIILIVSLISNGNYNYFDYYNNLVLANIKN
jgi:hypothetical protein